MWILMSVEVVDLEVDFPGRLVMPARREEVRSALTALMRTTRVHQTVTFADYLWARIMELVHQIFVLQYRLSFT